MTDIQDKYSSIDYTAEIARFYTEFPEQRDTIFIINPDKHSSVADFIDDTPAFAAKIADYQNVAALRANGLSEDDLEIMRDKYMIFNPTREEKFYNKGGYCDDILDLQDFLDNVAAHGPCRFASFVMPFKNTHPTQSRYMGAFDHYTFQDSHHLHVSQRHNFHHEIGHALYNQRHSDGLVAYLDNNHKDRTFRHQTEAGAECYALIRLFQDYGAEHEGIQFIFAERTFDRLLDPDSPYNFLPAMHEVARQAKEGALDNLSPQDSADLADKITQEKVILPEQSRYIHMFFRSSYEKLALFNSVDTGANHFAHYIANIQEPVVLNDAQYILQCLEDVTANDPKIQASVKRMWDGLKKNKHVQEHGLTPQYMRAKDVTARPRPSLFARIKRQFTP